MLDDKIDDEMDVGIISHFKTARRWEIVYGFFGIVLIFGGLIVWASAGTALGVASCSIGGLCISAAFGMRMDRRESLEKLSAAGPAAIGPLIEALYFDHTSEEESITEERKRTATSIAKLLEGAPSEHLLTLTDREAECLYRPEANWTDGVPDYQLLLLDHLIVCKDTRALPWVVRLLRRTEHSGSYDAVQDRAIFCGNELILKRTNDRARNGLLRPATGLSSLLQPVDGYGTSDSDSRANLLRPAVDTVIRCEQNIEQLSESGN